MINLYMAEHASSLLMWECGLKHMLSAHWVILSLVTPYVGVWIETYMLIYFYTYLKSLLMWECGLKHLLP